MIPSNKYKKRLQELAGIIESVEMEDIDKKSKLVVMDFDGTLVDTPLPTDENKAIWKEKTGKSWEGGWFGNSDSLNLDVFEMPTIPSVISSYRKEKSNPNSLVIMLTGRIMSVSMDVKRVLNHHGLKFDDYLFNDGGETSKNKIKHMEMILKYNPNIRTVEIFDDRDSHIQIFQEWGDEMIKQGYIDDFKIHHIKGERHQKKREL